MAVLDRSVVVEMLKKGGFKGVRKFTDEQMVKRLRLMVEDGSVPTGDRFDSVTSTVRRNMDGPENCLSISPDGKKEVVRGDRATATMEKPRKKRVSQEELSVLRKKVGICQTILDALKRASIRRPITKDKIFDILVDKYPDRDPEKMRGTVDKFTYWIPRRGVELMRNDRGGYWIETV